MSPIFLLSVLFVFGILVIWKTYQRYIGPRSTKYTIPNPGGGWMRKTKRSKRSLDSVVISASIKNDIINTITDFLSSKKWYKEMEIPYRLGIVLFGPPGNGKSSLIEAISYQ